MTVNKGTSVNVLYIVVLQMFMREAAVGERIALRIRTPQVPGSKLGGYSTHYTKLLTGYHHNSIIKLSVC